MGRYPETVLLLLEGYDEFTGSTCPELASIAKRQNRHNLACITTCRTHAASDLKHEGVVDSHIKVCGFTVEATGQYIGKFFERNTEQKDGLTEKIEQSDDLKKYRKYPAVLLLMCILWRDSSSLADTFTGFYKDFVCYLCGRYENRSRGHAKKTPRSKLLTAYKEHLLQIGKLALMGLKGGELLLTFSEEEVAQIAGEEAKDLGFLQTSELHTGEKEYSFFHKTLQEFFAAFYIVNCGQDEGLELLLAFCSSSKKLEESKMITTFVCGLSTDMPDHIRNTIEHAISKWDTDTEVKARNRTEVLMNFLAENKDVQFPLPEAIEVNLDDYDTTRLERFFNMDASELKTLKLEVNHPTVLCCLGQMKSSPLDLLQIKASKATGLRNVCVSSDFALPLCKSIRVHGFQTANAEQLREMMWDCCSDASLLCIDVAGQWVNDETIGYLTSAISDLTAIRELHIHKHSCSYSKPMADLMGALAGCSFLEVLDIELNKVGQNDVLEKLSQTIPSFNGLRVLKINKCSGHIKDAMGHVITQMQTHAETLQVISFSDTTLDSGATVLLSELLKQTESLQELYLANSCPTSCSNKSKEALLKSLEDVTSLACLDLSETVLTVGHFQVLGKVFQSMKELRKLYLTNCRGDDDSASSEVINSLGGALSLQVLSLKGNKLGPRSFSQLRAQIGKFQHLLKLNLSDCCLNDAEGVLELLRKCSECREPIDIDLSHNSLGNKMSNLCKIVPCLGNLRSIDLRNTGIGEIERKRIGRKVAEMQPLLRVKF